MGGLCVSAKIQMKIIIMNRIHPQNQKKTFKKKKKNFCFSNWVYRLLCTKPEENENRKSPNSKKQQKKNWINKTTKKNTVGSKWCDLFAAAVVGIFCLWNK